MKINDIIHGFKLIRKLEIDEVEGVDGAGLMLGVRLKSKKAADILTQAADKGLLILTAKTKLRFLPPLNIKASELEESVEMIGDALDELFGEESAE